MEKKVCDLKGSIFDLNALDPGSWFNLEDGGRVCVRLCSGARLSEIRKITVKEVAEIHVVEATQIPHRIVHEEINVDLFNEMLWDYCITNWEKILDKDGNDIPCTKENKILLTKHSPRFRAFIEKCFTQLTVLVRQGKEKSEKN